MVGSTSGSAPEQVRIMENLITQGVSAIGVSPLDGESIKPVMEEALEEGIPVFTSDADAADSPRMVYVAQALDKDLGYTLMDRLVAQTGEQAQIAIISGDPTIQSMANWVNFMTERAEQEYPDVEIVDIRYTPGGSAEESIRQAEELMTLYPDLKGIVGVASTNIASVPQAVEAAGKAGEIAVIGFGSPNTVREYIKAGVIKEAILWDPEELGYLSYWAALQLIQGNEFEEVNNVPGLDQPIQYFAEDQVLLLGDPLVIDADNVDDFDF
jgi:rhamnose transport system substrate-binding protein